MSAREAMSLEGVAMTCIVKDCNRPGAFTVVNDEDKLGRVCRGHWEAMNEGDVVELIWPT